MAYDFDLTVIGGGLGGYVAAIRASQLGARTALVEKIELGGTCLNRGCIPTKALICSIEKLNIIREAGLFGVGASIDNIDFTKMMNRKNDVVAQLRNGVAYLMGKNHVTIIKAETSFNDEHTLTWAEGTLTSERIIIASGSLPKRLNTGINNPRVLSSDEILELKSVPSSLAIIGGGVIGIEFAGIFNALGSKVTVVEYCDNILPNIDRELGSQLKNILSEKGIEIFTGSKVEDINDNRITVSAEKDGSRKEISAELILCATGRVPNMDNLALEKAGVEYNAKGIAVNENLITNKPHIAAIGDVLGRMQLAHLASAQGIKAAEMLLKGESHVNTDIVPSCIFCTPELASVGLSEEQAIAQKLEWQKVVFPMWANSKAIIMGETTGIVKAVFRPSDGKLLGLHILAPHATDIIAEAAVAMANNMTIEELGNIIHPHPTIAETILETMHLAANRPINI